MEDLLDALDDEPYVDLLLFANHTAHTYYVYDGGSTYSLSSYFSGMDDEYPSAVTRLENFYSNRSGDVIVLADASGGYYFDEGDMEGEHGGLSWDQSMVPLVFAGPGIKHGFNNTRVSNVDIAPTIADLLGFSMDSADGVVLPVEAGDECGDQICSLALLRPLETTDVCTLSESENVTYRINVTYTTNVYLDVPSTGDFDLLIDTDCNFTNGYKCYSATDGNGVDEDCTIIDQGVYYVTVESYSGFGEYALTYGADCDGNNKPDILDGPENDNCDPYDPMLISPENGSIVENVTVDGSLKYNALSFYWSYPFDPGGSGIKQFEIEISNSSGIVKAATVTQNTYTIYDLPEMMYYWKVKAIDNNGNGNGSLPTEYQVYLNDVQPPIPPVLQCAAQGYNSSTGEYNVTWEPAIDPSGIHMYHLQEATNDEFTQNLEDYTTSNWYYQVSGSSGTYYYRVRANDTQGHNSSWSNTGWFNIDGDETTFAKRLNFGWNLVSIPLDMSGGGEEKSGGGESKDEKKETGGGEKSAGGSNCTIYNVSQGLSGNESMPSLPSMYSGYALVNGSLVSDGTNVSVYVNGTNELVGRGSTCSDGEYQLIVYYDEDDNASDGNAVSGDYVYWQIGSDNATTPSPGSSQVIGGANHADYVLSVGDVPTKIVDYEPVSSTPSVKVGESLGFSIIAIAPNPDSLTYLWMVDGSSKNITSSWTYYPNAFEVGNQNVTVIASSDTDYDTYEWNVTVQPQCSGNYPYPVGDWNITSNTSCANTNITLSGNSSVNVIGNVTLSFENVTLVLEDGELMAYDGGGSNGIIDSIVDTIIDWIT